MEFLQIDVPALLIAILSSIACALTGSFLVLKKQAMLGDALSHVVLPGIVVVYLVTGDNVSSYMALGALGACLISVAMIAVIQRLARIDNHAAIGIVFTAMFAAGLVMLETQIGSQVHLDAHHALYGSMELSYWPELKKAGDLLTIAAWRGAPDEIHLLLQACLLIGLVIALFYKEIRLAVFDPSFAQVTGMRPGAVNAVILFLSAIACVAAFKAVGSILVVAMIICPAATARMMTDQLHAQLWLSVVFGIISSILGYFSATAIPLWLGMDNALNGAAMIAVTAGLIQLLAMLFAPKYGVLARKAATP